MDGRRTRRSNRQNPGSAVTALTGGHREVVGFRGFEARLRLRAGPRLFRPFRKCADRVHKVVNLVRVRVLLPAAAAGTQGVFTRATVVIGGVQAIVQGLVSQPLNSGEPVAALYIASTAP